MGAQGIAPLPSPRSGVAFPETNAVHAVCVAPHDDNLRALLTHEANHVIMQNGLGRAGTGLMNEGLATAVARVDLESVRATRGVHEGRPGRGGEGACRR